MAITLEQIAEFRDELPELNQYSDSQVRRYLGLAEQMHGTRRKAQIYAAAHMLVLSDEPVRRGQKDVQYWNETEYGRIFLQLEERSPAHTLSAILVGSGRKR